MKRLLSPLLCGALFACGDPAESANEAAPANTVTAECAGPVLALDKSDASFAKAFADGSKALTETKANFAAAFAAACAKGLLKDKTLPGGTANPPWLYLLNAPSANVASIYKTDAGRPVLEFSFVADGGVHVPPADALEEAIYCHVRGATEAEQAESGRCLVD